MCLFIHYQIPAGEEHRYSAWWYRDAHATWPSGQLLYSSSSTEEINLFGWKFWIYLKGCIKGGFCMLPCCLDPGERGRKISRVDLLHSRNSTVILFLFHCTSFKHWSAPSLMLLHTVSLYEILLHKKTLVQPCSGISLKALKFFAMLSLLRCSCLFVAAQEEMVPKRGRSLPHFSYCGQHLFILPRNNSSSVRISFIHSDEVSTRVGTQKSKACAVVGCLPRLTRTISTMLQLEVLCQFMLNVNRR